MYKQIYFDSEEYTRGNFFALNGEIRSEEGHLYELEEWVGRGGSGAVFKGQRQTTGDPCAIKFLMTPGLTKTKRFLREVRLLKTIHGDHVTRYHGSGRVAATHFTHKRRFRDMQLPFVIMELADRNLQEVMEKEGAIRYERYAGQFRGLAQALAMLHEQAVHRDIKPENILIVGERWLLSDYGLCTFVKPGEEELTLEGQNVGPKFWLSPEAHNRRLGHSDEINAASDVYQLAAIFWYVATGRHPSGIVTEDDWTGPAKLFPLLHRSLFHDWRRRPRNGEEFLAALVDSLSQ